MILHLTMSVYLLVWQLGNYGQHFGEYNRFFSVNCLYHFPPSFSVIIAVAIMATIDVRFHLTPYPCIDLCPRGAC